MRLRKFEFEAVNDIPFNPPLEFKSEKGTLGFLQVFRHQSTRMTGQGAEVVTAYQDRLRDPAEAE